MLTNLSGLTHWVGDKAYHFMCDANSPLTEVKDALFEFLKYVGKIEDAVAVQKKAQDEADAAKKLEQPPVPESEKIEQLQADMVS